MIEVIENICFIFNTHRVWLLHINILDGSLLTLIFSYVQLLKIKQILSIIRIVNRA